MKYLRHILFLIHCSGIISTVAQPYQNPTRDPLTVLSSGEFLGFYTTLQNSSPVPYPIDVVSFPSINGSSTTISSPWDTYNFIQNDVLLPTNTSAYNPTSKELACLVFREKQLLYYNDNTGMAISPVDVSPSSATAPVFLQGTLYGIDVENGGYGVGPVYDFEIVSIDPQTGLMNGVSPFQFSTNNTIGFNHETMSSATNRIDEIYFLSGSHLLIVPNPNPFNPTICWIDLAPNNTFNNYSRFYGLEYRRPGVFLAIRETFVNGNRTGTELVEITVNSAPCSLGGITVLYDLAAHFNPSPAGWVVNSEFYSTTFDTCHQRYYMSTLFNQNSASRLVEIDLPSSTHTEQILPKYLFGIEWKYTPCPCKANFTYFSEDSCAIFNFTNLSTGPPPLAYSWGFDDPLSGPNNFSSLQNPSHQFTTCGNYLVCMTVYGPGCMDTYCQNVSVLDITSPVALCKQGYTIPLDAHCMAVVTPGDIDDGSFDNCMIQSLTVSPNTFTQCGNFPVILTVTDWCGNTGICNTSVQVIDNNPPVIIGPADVHITTTNNNCIDDIYGLHWVHLTDNCGISGISYSITGASAYTGVGDASGLLFNQGVSTVIYTATDNCGNTASCSFQVTVDCICDCPGNLILNSGFSIGAAGGDFGNGGNSNNWQKGKETPQVSMSDFCCEPVSIQMWGRRNTGEAIFQDNIPIQAGHHYKISFCAKFLPLISNSGFVRFGFTGAPNVVSGAFDPFNCTNCENAGNSNTITNTFWNAYSLPIWTPTQNWSRLYIRVFHNSTNIQTWGRIDNICMEEVAYRCCEDEEAFVENASHTVQVYPDQESLEGVFDVGNLMECNAIDFIDWGDGQITTGPIIGNSITTHQYNSTGDYQVTYQIREFDSQDSSQQTCFRHIFRIPVIFLPDSCFCGGFTNLKFNWPNNQSMADTCGNDPTYLGCPPPGNGYNFTGVLFCAGTNCPNTSTINWTITGPSGVYSGTVNSNPYFGITILPTYVALPGVYTLSLLGNCGSEGCSCNIQFVVDCPNLCPCTTVDIAVLSNAVNQGFAQAISSSSCTACYSPVALSSCETVDWHIGTISPIPLATTIGNQSFCHTFPSAGSYTVIMVINRNRPDGTKCETFTYSKQVTVSCLIGPDCNDPKIFNPGFNLGSLPGGLNTGGKCPGWAGLSGNPFVLDSIGESNDGWVILLKGNNEFTDVLQSEQTFCFPATAGTLTLRAKQPSFEDDLPRPRPRPLPRDIVKADILFENTILSSISVPLTEIDSSSWWTIQFPFNLSEWASLDTCNNDPGSIPVKLRLSVSNALSNDQGESYTFSQLWIDDLCFDNTVSSYTPPEFQAIMIFPNPSNREIHIKSSDLPTSNLHIRILTTTGQNVTPDKIETDHNEMMVPVDHLPEGIYFVEIMTGKKIVSISRFVKVSPR